jgi:acetylglutamate kinase
MATEPVRPGASPSPPPLPATAEAVLTFLESVGRRSEAELYLGVFSRLAKESFAVIAPGATVVRQGKGALAEQLRFLADLGLRAPIVLGLLGSPPDPSLTERFMKRLELAGLCPKLHASEEPSLASTLRVELSAGEVPVVEARGGGSPEDRVRWVGALTSELDTRKVVLLRRHGPLHLLSERASLAEQHALAVENGGLSLVNLRTDAELVLGHKLLRRDDARLLELSSLLLESSAARRLLVSITSPLDLLRELFTVKGAGTLVKRGSRIRRETSYDAVDRPRIEGLLESSFGASVCAAFFDTPPRAVLLEEEHRAVAILHDTPVAPYLAKFAVDRVAQGEGLGRDLWQVVEREFPRMFWRTRAENPISAWYASVCDGLVRTPQWHVFWRGLEPESIPSIVEHARALGDDFVR